ncbi:MAG: DUF1499 domain-containing protein [Dechloromonas sp.]|nr:DUF1499 domain-containing protein [Dechloromonas sp.]
MRLFKWLAIGAGIVVAVLLGAGQLGLFQGTPPGDLGVRDGRLKGPADTPNSVSSQARLWPDHPQREYAGIAPLSLRGDGSETIARLQALMHSESGASIVESRPDYLRVQFTTRLMKFVDDAEFWFDPAAGVVQVRSASRVGRKDFGVNRQRIERLRARLAGSP